MNFSEEYQDNLFYTKTDKIKSWKTVVSPRLDLNCNSKVLRSGFSGIYSYNYFAVDRDLNTNEWSLDHHLSWNITERDLFSSRVALAKDESIDRYFLSTGIINDLRQLKSMNADISYQRLFTERMTIELNADLGDEAFSYSEQSGKSNYTLNSWAGSLGLQFQGDDQTSWSLYLGFGSYDYESKLVEQAYLSMGVNRAISDVLSWSMSLGGRYTVYTYDWHSIDYSVYPPKDLLEEIKTYTHAFIGNAGLTYKLDSRIFDISIDQNFQPSTGQGESVNRTAVSASWMESFSQAFRLTLSSSYFLNQSDNDYNKEDIQSESLVLGLRGVYDLTDDLSLVAEHQYYNYWKKSYDVDKHISRVSLKYVFK